MSENRLGGIAAVLKLRRNAAIGFTIGAAIAGLAFAYRVGELLGPVGATRGSPFLFFLLSVVLAFSAGFLITTLLTAATAAALLRAER